MHEVRMSRQQFFVAVGVLGLAGVALLILAFHPLPDRNDNAFNILLGALIGWGGAVLAFAFPGNINTQAKDTAISALSAAAASPSTTTTTTTEMTNVTTRTADDKGRVGDGPRASGGATQGATAVEPIRSVDDFDIPDTPPGVGR